MGFFFFFLLFCGVTFCDLWFLEFCCFSCNTNQTNPNLLKKLRLVQLGLRSLNNEVWFLYQQSRCGAKLPLKSNHTNQCTSLIHSSIRWNIYLYIYIYIYRWVQVTRGVTLVKLHIFYTVNF